VCVPARTPATIDLANSFKDRFGDAPFTIVRAPGRVDLMGSHTDYNDGAVLTLAIDRETRIAGRRRDDRRLVVRSTDVDAEAAIDLDSVDRELLPAWARYVAGVAVMLEADGIRVPGADAVIASTVPIGSGLSSSAALECATATLVEALAGIRLDPLRKAQLCQRAENQFVGVNCGILDQYTSIFAEASRALLLDCRDLTSRPIALPEGIAVLIGDTRAPRMLAASEYGARRAACEGGARSLGVRALRDVRPDTYAREAAGLDPLVRRRCQFVIDEHARVLAMAQALESGDRRAMQDLCDDSFAGARDLYEIVVPAMTAMRDAMRAAPGIIGARQAGAGFGGCLVALVETEAVEAFTAHAAAAYRARAGWDGHVFPVRACDGAGPAPV
jgi:galactokinase